MASRKVYELNGYTTSLGFGRIRLEMMSEREHTIHNNINAHVMFLFDNVI